MLTWLFAGMLVFLFNVYLPAALYFPAVGFKNHMGARDDLPEPNKMVQRARRSLNNFQENMAVFLALGILSLVIDKVNMEMAVLGAQMFVISRMAYIIFYMISIPFTRSLAYGIGFVGMFMMAFALV